MKIGTVKEIVDKEFRVGLTPSAAHEYILGGHSVFIETNAGLNSGFSDDDYKSVGAVILNSAKEVWESVDLIAKVKEPLPLEYKYFRNDLIIYTFLHLSAHYDLLEALLKNKTTSVAYETIELTNGKLPCLEPMSEIAGRISILEGLRYLHSNFGNLGKLISGVKGVKPANVTIIGAGNAGSAALDMAHGLRANVTILDINLEKLESLSNDYKGIHTLISNEENIKKALSSADLVISTIALPGDKTPKIIKRAYYKDMKKGSIIVDVAIDQGGSTEVAKSMSISEPTFIIDDIIHYAVPNMPSLVHQTATVALNNATTKYGLELAKGLENINSFSNELKLGINTHNGVCTNKTVANVFNIPHKNI